MPTGTAATTPAGATTVIERGMRRGSPKCSDHTGRLAGLAAHQLAFGMLVEQSPHDPGGDHELELAVFARLGGEGERGDPELPGDELAWMHQQRVVELLVDEVGEVPEGPDGFRVRLGNLDEVVPALSGTVRGEAHGCERTETAGTVTWV